MAIKFKINRVCETTRGIRTSQNGHETHYYCWDEEVPIRDWQFSPETINLRWAEDNPIPTSQLITIIFAEEEKTIQNVARQVRNVRYVIKKSHSGGYTPPDVIELQGVSDSDLQNIPVKDDGKVQFRVSFKNFDLLQQGDNTVELYLGIMGTVLQNGEYSEVELDAKSYSIVIRKVDENQATSPYITTNKKTYNITYIKSTETLKGDTEIEVHVHNLPIYDRALSVSFEESPIKTHFKTIFINPVINETFKSVSIRESANWQQLPIGKHKVDATVSLWDFLNIDTETKIVLQINVKENEEGLEVSQSLFSFELLLHENKTASGAFQIQNPNNLPITIEKSSWINIQQSGNEITFTTKTAQELEVGEKRGTIEIISGHYRRIVLVIVRVKKTIDDSLRDINFCLDRKHIIVRKQHTEAEFLKAHFKMAFQGYGKDYHSIEQIYEYVFFNNEVTLYPGEEVQDFFTEISALEQMQINERDIVSPRNIFKACLTEITISEYDKNGVVYKTEKLNPIYFLPGKTPKAYPYLTNGTVRSTYSQSLICVSALREEFIGKNLGEVAGNMIDTTSVTIPKMVVTMAFRRHVADRAYGEQNVIKKGNFELLPIPNAQQVIDVLFQNQNFCPDWFSFSGEIEQHEDLTHTLSENIRNGQDFKAHVERKTTLKLNTGWLLEEEIELLTELIVSPICFAKIQNKWLRLIPISKKSLPYDNQASLRSFIVEFNVSE